MDARGGQNLLAHLDYLDRHEGEVPWREAPPAFAADRDPRSLRERARLASRSLTLHAHARARAAGLTRYGSAAAGTGAASAARASSPPDLAADDQRATREMSWRLALVGRAMAELWQRRGLAEAPFLLPISVDLRPKGDPGPTFGNQLAFHFAQVPAVRDERRAGELARAIRRQMAEAVRDGEIEANAVAMEFLQYHPLSRHAARAAVDRGGRAVLLQLRGPRGLAARARRNASGNAS